MALDGVRQVVVVTATNSANEPGPIRQLAAIALLFGATVAAGVALAGRFALGLSWAEVLPLAATCFCLLALGPGHARIEASGGPHLAVALHSIAWSTALVLGAALAAHDGDATHMAWAMLVAPLIILGVLAARGLLVAPSLRGDGPTWRLASQGIRSHVVTAISGFLDKGAMAIHGGPFALGLYTPLSELTGRASALGGMVANLFLNDETRSTAPGFGIARRSSPHLLLMDVFFVFAAAGIVAGALLHTISGTVRCPIEPVGGAGLQAATRLSGAEHRCPVECRDLGHGVSSTGTGPTLPASSRHWFSRPFSFHGPDRWRCRHRAGTADSGHRSHRAGSANGKRGSVCSYRGSSDNALALAVSGRITSGSST